MTRIVRFAIVLPVIAAFALPPSPVLAQGTTTQSAMPPASTAPASPSNAAVVPTSGNPNLAVASVRMEGGTRASKIIGAGVYSDANTQIGTVDDLMLTPDNRVALVIVSVGGLIGIGGKLTAVPIGQIQHAADGKLMLPGASKESLTAEPNFIY